MGGLYGLEEVLRELDLMEEEIDEAMDDIAKEVATEILDEAIENVNGPDTDNLTGLGQPYPVGVITGTLKRSLKIKKLGKHRYKVYSDMTVAKYAYWVHDGTWKMEARPFFDDAVITVMDTKKYLNVAEKILDDILSRRW
jgi:HK97 gp10 family phage protein